MALNLEVLVSTSQERLWAVCVFFALQRLGFFNQQKLWQIATLELPKPRNQICSFRNGPAQYCTAYIRPSLSTFWTWTRARPPRTCWGNDLLKAPLFLLELCFPSVFLKGVAKGKSPKLSFLCPVVDQLSPVLQKLFSLCFFFDSSGCPSPKRLPISRKWHRYTHRSYEIQHQSSRFMDVAFVAMRIWHFHRNKARRPPEERLLKRVSLRVLWCVFVEGSKNVSEMAGCKWILVLWWTMINEYKWCTCVFHFTLKRLSWISAQLYTCTVHQEHSMITNTI